MKAKGSMLIDNNFNPKSVEDLDLEDALDVAGMGRYQLHHCALMLATLSTALLEMIGNAFILPAAACDLNIPDYLKGILTSIPNIGIILTAPFWGYAADNLGRKPVLRLSTAAAGLIGLTAAFMPNLVTYALCKFAASLFLSCPSSLGFAYAGELIPKRRRDKTLLIINGFLVLSTTLSPVLAWFILSMSPSIHIGSSTILPWRILTAVYSIPLILTSWWMTCALESPKYLMTKEKTQEALECLKQIYSTNTSLFPEDYPVVSLRRVSEEGPATVASSLLPHRHRRRESLLRPPHIQWLLLTGFLMFGLFSLLNGLFLFAPDVINRASSGSNEAICTSLSNLDKTPSASCEEPVSQRTFIIMAVTTGIYGLVVLGVGASAISKRVQMIAMFITVAVTCLLAGLSTNRYTARRAIVSHGVHIKPLVNYLWNFLLVQGVSMSALQLTSLGVGALAAYAVRLFPTTLRGTAVGAVLMCGRMGSVAGANAAGYFLTFACTATFYGFATLLCLCAVLSFLLPKDEPVTTTDNIELQ